MSRFRETVITLFFRRLKMNALIISSLVIFQMAGLVASLPGETTTIWLKHYDYDDDRLHGQYDRHVDVVMGVYRSTLCNEAENIRWKNL